MIVDDCLVGNELLEYIEAISRNRFMAHLTWPDILGPGQQFPTKNRYFIIYLCIIIFENNNIPKKGILFWAFSKAPGSAMFGCT
jgi:hypothetical protein